MIDFNTPINLNHLADKPLESDNSPLDFIELHNQTEKKPRKKRETFVSEEALIKQYTEKKKKSKKEAIPTYIPRTKKTGTAQVGVEPLSEEDKEYIADNAGKKLASDIADDLGKKRSTVRRYMEKYGLLSAEDKKGVDNKKKILNELHNQAFWKRVLKMFDPDEIDYYEETWCEFVEQLDDNIEATERLSLRTLIETQIQLDRLSINEYRINNDIAKLEERIDELEELAELSEQDNDHDEVMRIRAEIQTLNVTKGSLATARLSTSRDRDNLMKSQSKAMSDLDVTRARRVEKYDMSDKTWAKMCLAIKENPRLKKQMNAYAYISFLATERMRGKLTKPYTYADGETGYPMLLPEGFNSELAHMVETLYVPQET